MNGRAVRMFLASAFFTISLLSTLEIATDEGPSWGLFRGANAGQGLSEKDVKDFAGFGGNLYRLSFLTLQFINLKPNYAFNEDAFAMFCL